MDGRNNSQIILLFFSSGDQGVGRVGGGVLPFFFFCWGVGGPTFLGGTFYTFPI